MTCSELFQLLCSLASFTALNMWYSVVVVDWIYLFICIFFNFICIVTPIFPQTTCATCRSATLVRNHWSKFRLLYMYLAEFVRPFHFSLTIYLIRIKQRAISILSLSIEYQHISIISFVLPDGVWYFTVGKQDETCSSLCWHHCFYCFYSASKLVCSVSKAWLPSGRLHILLRLLLSQ